MKTHRLTKSILSLFVVLALIPAILAGCSAMQTDTGKGAAIVGGSGALIGALVDHSNPWAGALMGAASGALAGGLVGHFMDQRKQDLEKTLQPEINSGAASVTELPGNALQVSMTGQSAFPPDSAVINSDFISTLQKIGNVVSTYGKMTIAVIGYPDAGANTPQQQSLAYQRAEAVRVQFISLGVKPALVTATDYPGTPLTDGRVQIILTPLTSK